MLKDTKKETHIAICVYGNVATNQYCNKESKKYLWLRLDPHGFHQRARPVLF
jgi:hypothetical protein